MERWIIKKKSIQQNTSIKFSIFGMKKVYLENEIYNLTDEEKREINHQMINAIEENQLCNKTRYYPQYECIRYACILNARKQDIRILL